MATSEPNMARASESNPRNAISGRMTRQDVADMRAAGIPEYDIQRVLTEGYGMKSGQAAALMRPQGQSRAKSIGDINEQAGRMLAMNNANATRTRRIQNISKTYRDNINKRLKSVENYSSRARIKVSSGVRRGVPYASLR